MSNNQWDRSITSAVTLLSNIQSVFLPSDPSIILNLCSFVVSLYLHYILLKVGDQKGAEFA